MRRLDGVPSTSPHEKIDSEDSLERTVKLAIVGSNAMGATPRVWLCVTASLETGEITCALRKM